MKLARACSLAALFVAALCAPALARTTSTPSPSPAPSAIPEIGHVVTSDRRPEHLSAASRPTFIVDRATIENFGARSVANALASVPGVSLFSYGGFGAQVNYGLRGTSSAETLVLLNGVPITAASNGVVDLGELPTLGLERIEVVESGASTLYGTSATGGVINLITTQNATPFLRASIGSYGDRDLAVGAPVGPVSIWFERHVATNDYAFPAFGSGATGTPGGVRVNADAEQTALRLGYHLQLGAWSGRLDAGSDTVHLGVPGSLAYAPTPEARQNTGRRDAQLSLERELGGGTLTVTAAGSTQALAYADPGPSLGGESDTYDARMQGSLRYVFTGRRTDLVAGIDLARESAALSFAPSVPSTPPLTAAEAQVAVYAQLGVAAGKAAHLAFGLRGENDAPRGEVLAPSLGATLDAAGFRLAANIGESFRVPTLIDLYYPGFSNPNLVPERVTDYDLSVQRPLSRATVTLGLFGRDGSNLIVLNPTTFAPYNASRISVNGLQFTVGTRALRHLRIEASATDVYRALDTATGTRLPSTPPITATFRLERPFDGGPLAFGALVRIVGATAGDGPDPLAYDAYTRADAYARYRLAPAAILTLRVRDLGDTRYAPIYGYPAPGRTIELELATR